MTIDETPEAREGPSGSEDDFVIEVSDDGIVVKRSDVSFRIPRGEPRFGPSHGRISLCEFLQRPGESAKLPVSRFDPRVVADAAA